MSRKPPNESLPQLLADALELTKQGIAVSSRLDEERQKDIEELRHEVAAIFAMLNGDDGLVTRCRIFKEWMDDHKRRCASLADTDRAGIWNLKSALIALAGVIIAAVIGGLCAVWAAKIGK